MRTARLLLGLMLALIATACADRPAQSTAEAAAGAKAGAAAVAASLRFIEDAPAALAEAKTRGVPVFVEAWAPW
jgi:hypothetical protein